MGGGGFEDFRAQERKLVEGVVAHAAGDDVARTPEPPVVQVTELEVELHAEVRDFLVRKRREDGLQGFGRRRRGQSLRGPGR